MKRIIGGKREEQRVSFRAERDRRVPHPFASLAKGWETKTVHCHSLMRPRPKLVLDTSLPRFAPKPGAKDGAPSRASADGRLPRVLPREVVSQCGEQAGGCTMVPFSRPTRNFRTNEIA